MDFTEKRLAASILALTSLAAEERAAETATAAKVLGELHGRAGIAAEKAYAAAAIAMAKRLGGGTEPWIAFASAGPGLPPPAVELLKPPPDEPESGWWQVFKQWTGPGQMYSILFEGELPANQLTDLANLVTQNVAAVAVAGAGLVVDTAKAAANLSIGKLAAGLAAIVGGYLYLKKNRKAK